jgi:predicted AlkP superfamily pyrophosphatase or phosphodiesterase
MEYQAKYVGHSYATQHLSISLLNKITAPKSFIKSTLITLTLAVSLNIGIATGLTSAQPQSGVPHPKVILISLDGATPRILNQYLQDGSIPQNEGLGLLMNKGVVASQNITCTPSLTAVCHIAIGTGSTAARNDINSNTFHLVASPFENNISGFAAPIGGYTYDASVPSESAEPTSNPLWLALRANGKKVISATFPGADGIDVKVPGLANSPVIQPSILRTVDYTVPFGAFGGAGSMGFSLIKSDFTIAPQKTIDQLKTLGITSYNTVQKTSPLDNFTINGVNYTIQVAALDTTNDQKENYDTLVFFDDKVGIQGPGQLPETGSAFVKAEEASKPFYLVGSCNIPNSNTNSNISSNNCIGTSFYISKLSPDLSKINIARYSTNYIPSTPPIQNDVLDINENVGFWIAQADFRIPEKLIPSFKDFSDGELEEIYEDQVRTFIDYQTRLALRAIHQNPDADLSLFYIEEPDGSSHQFWITDPRQATNPLDPLSIGDNQDQNKIQRYQTYIRTAYQAANQAVQKIIQAVGTNAEGVPNSDIFVVSDHGFSEFNTAVSINNLLKNSGIADLADSNKVRAITSGPAVNIYINLQGREPNGKVSRSEYITLQQQIVSVLNRAVDKNPNYTLGNHPTKLFSKIYSRPATDPLTDPNFGLGTSQFIGQDSGDVFAIMSVGYNFDGTQTPAVQRLGDPTSTSPIFSVPNFYGAHGYDPNLPEMSAIFYAAGPDIRHGIINQVRNIDVAPTISQLLGVQPATTVQGHSLLKQLR